MAYQSDRIKQIPAPQPVDYDRQTNFTDYETVNPGKPMRGADLDAEFNVIEQALDETQARARLIQRDDGSLVNSIVNRDALSSQVIAGVKSPTTWATGTVYAESDSVIVYDQPGQTDPAWYVAEQGHTATVFADDLTAGKWRLLVDLSTLLVDAGKTQVTTGSGTQDLDDSLNQRLIVFQTEADMKAEPNLAVLTPPITAITLGKTSAGDGEGQTFKIVASGGDVVLDNGNEAQIVSKHKSATGTQTVAAALDDRSLTVVSVPALLSLDKSQLEDNKRIDLTSFRPGAGKGGGLGYYDANRSVSDHDGALVISLTVPWDGTQGGLSDFLAGVGETDPGGTGCWVRSKTKKINPYMFGAQGGDADDLVSLRALAGSIPDGATVTNGGGEVFKTSDEISFSHPDSQVKFSKLKVNYLGTATGKTALLRLNFKTLVASQCDFRGVEADTAYTVLIDGPAGVAAGKYTFKDSTYCGYAKFAAYQLRRVKKFSLIDSEVEDISEFHGVGAERTQQTTACERIVIKRNKFINVKKYFADVHSLKSTVNDNECINCGWGTKNQLSLAGDSSYTNVDRETVGIAENNSWYFDADTAKYAMDATTDGQFVFFATEYGKSKGNTVVVKNLPSGTIFRYCVNSVLVKFITQDNDYVYNCPLQLSNPYVRATRLSGKMFMLRDTYDIEQFNEFSIDTDGLDRLDIIGCDFRLGPVDGARPNRFIIGNTTVATRVNYKDNHHEGDTPNVAFRPLQSTNGDIVSMIVTGNQQIDGAQPILSGVTNLVQRNNIGITDA